MRDIISDIGYNGLYGNKINSNLSIEDNIILALKSYYKKVYGIDKNVRIIKIKDKTDCYSVVVTTEHNGLIAKEKFSLDKYDLWIID
ncbi:MAG: hypothetical protein II956_06565 [Bacteroidales bacterium]|nr:hypothetical protein [Bacteroidales bacterium]